MAATMRRLARTDPNWQALPADQRLLLAGQQAVADIRDAAQRKVDNASRQAIKAAEIEDRLQAHQQRQGSGRAKALVEDFARTDAYIDGVKRDATRQLMDLIDASTSGQGAGAGRRALMLVFDAENPQMSRDLALEVFAQGKGGTGNALARKGAEAWGKVTEAMRQRFNAGGGDVGRLDYGYLPQAHDQRRVLQAGRDQWATDVLPMLDRSRYVREDGSRMADAEVLDLLRGAWETISTDGANKAAPGQRMGAGATANKGIESREIHFKDGEAYLDYLGRFGQGSMYDAMVGHVGGLSRDIGLVERYGPNPEAQMRVQFDLAERADGKRQSFGGQLAENMAGPKAQWAVLSGASGQAEHARIAQVGQNIRNIETFGKLQGAVLSSFTDLGTYFVTTGFNKLGYWNGLANIGRAMQKGEREWLNRHGAIAESMISDMNRWAGENIQNNWSGRIANATMRLSFMNAWTDTLRRAFSLTMMQGLGKLAKTEWGSLKPYDRWRMENKGLTEADWDLMRSAQPVQHRGMDFITPDGIYAIEDAVTDAANPARMQRVRDLVDAQTADLRDRNAQDQTYIKGRIDKFDKARDALNRSVKELEARKLKKNEASTEPLLQRMALLDAQRQAAQLQSDMEADFNRFVTQDEVRSFLNAVEDGASADLTDVGGAFGRGGAKAEVRQGLDTAQSIGRRYGERKGRLERRMRELETRISEMDRSTKFEMNAAAKDAEGKAAEMGKELADFIDRSQKRQARRTAVVDRLNRDLGPQLAAERQAYKAEVVAKMIGMIADESEIAVLNPDLATRAITSGGGSKKGTVGGELWRSVSQFKSFPIAMISRHWRRMLETPQGLEGAPMVANKLAYSSAMMVSLTALGAIAFQSKQIVTGKDPVDMTTTKFWSRALAQGGGLGFVGDLLLTNTADDRSSGDTIARLLGPTAGSAADLFELTKGNLDESLVGKQTHAGAEAFRFARSHAPLVNLWWGKRALDGAGLYALQENLSPGYLDRVKNKAKKDWGQDWWWKPGESAPERAPDLSAVAGN